GQSLIKDFAGVWGHALQFGDQYLEVNDGKVETFLTDDSFKDELQWLNKIYEEGLVDPEIFTQEYAKFAAKMAG
ncbi:ABC transporter substrate-binding protein, partial [Barnesiella sp. GGCC_0306]|nr:ABC transporter substrate-binding protein [Barnesiella sp. GGCC_0306]